jgi:hypothetical protein
LLEYGADVNYQTMGENTPIYMALERKKSNNVKMIELLLEKGANVNHVDVCESTPLHFAVHNSSNLEIVKMLIDYGSKINEADDENCTPLDIAVRNPSVGVEIIELLLANGAKFGFFRKTNDDSDDNSDAIVLDSKNNIIIKQQLSIGNCDKGYKNCLSTDGSVNGNKEKIKLVMVADECAVHVKLGQHGRYKLVIGYYYYKTKEEINSIIDISKLPKSHIIVKSGINYYRVDKYNIESKILESKGYGITILSDGSSLGYPLVIDILRLYKI